MIEKLRVPAEGRDPATSATRRLLARRTALLSVALLAFFLEGCQAICGPCSIPSRIGSGISNLGARVFNRRPAAYGGECCGGDAGVIVEQGGPVMLPGPAGISAPAQESGDGLAPIEMKKSTSTGGKTSLRSSPSGARTTFDVGRPATISDADNSRGEGVARAALTDPEPTSGSASGRSSSPLDHIPPVALADEISKRAARGGAAPPIEAEAIPRPIDRDPRKPVLEAGVKESPLEVPPLGGASSNLSPGISRMNVVEPKLAGGSVPNAEGLRWLKEKGYKTLIDLRDRDRVEPTFPAEVSKLGMLYLSMPFPATGLDQAFVSDFLREIEKASARPLYFMDQDGAKAGLLWYVRRVGIDKIDVESAKREAREIGSVSEAQWNLAAAYLTPPKPAESSTPPKPAEPEPKKQEAPKSASAVGEPNRRRSAPVFARGGSTSPFTRLLRGERAGRASLDASAR